MNPNYFIKTISLFLILCTFSYGQLIWSEGNLKKVDQISLEIVVSGDQDPTSVSYTHLTLPTKA